MVLIVLFIVMFMDTKKNPVIRVERKEADFSTIS